MKGRKGKANGGETMSGQKTWDEDLAKKNMRYTGNSNVDDEAEERKRGGKAVGKAMGKAGKMNAARAARKSGGRTGSNMNPLSSAHAGTPAKGRPSGNRYD